MYRVTRVNKKEEIIMAKKKYTKAELKKARIKWLKKARAAKKKKKK